MPLAMKDMKPSTVVDHAWEVGKDEITRPRQTIRRGLIVKVVGSQDKIDSIEVFFPAMKKTERVPASELDRVYPAGSRVARQAWERFGFGQPTIGEDFAQHQRMAPRRVEGKEFFQPSRSPLVHPPQGEEQFDGTEPTIIEDKTQEDDDTQSSPVKK